MSFDALAIAGFMLTLGLLEALGGLYVNSQRTKDDWWIEILSFVHSSTVSKPLIVLLSAFMMSLVLPHTEGVLSDTSLWISLPLVVLIEDFIQYWYHRKAHEWEWLWKLHRPHHTGPDMGVLVTFRENIFYVILIPNIWFLGIATYVGLGVAVAIGLVAKYIIVVSAHSDLKWDQWLYKYDILHPLAWIVERTISTPATHFAHHGKSSKDGISNPTGNFSNMFFFWDILFGTALITRKYPATFGVENDSMDHWAPQLYWPLIKSKNKESELGHNYKKKVFSSNQPSNTTVSKDQVYWWCSCGFSNNQPFCNGSHNGTKFKPIKIQFDEDQSVSWCTCKATKSPPYCDGSHKEFD